MTPSKQSILVICGPTASGKTSFALKVANAVIKNQSQSCHSRPEIGHGSSEPGGESIKINSKVNILSVDSRQVYKDLNIVTGKDIPENLPESIRLFGLDIFEIDEQSNLADFVKYSQKIIDDSIESSTPLIIVGGTGLYLKAITQNLTNATIPQDKNLRSEIEKLSLSELQARLKKLDEEKYESLNNSDVNNPRRLIRAIEISNFNHDKINSHSRPDRESIQRISKIQPNFCWLGFMPTKEDIAKSIQKRVLERIENGAISEVKTLLEKNSNTKLPIYSSLGVSQIIQYIQEEITMEEMTESWIKSEIDYARRQNVWFKKQTGIIWYDKSTAIDKLALKYAKAIINNHDQEKTR